MNIVNKVTLRHLKENKRRTLITIIGVIISVAMVTAVATLGFSFLDLMKRNNISENGEWHVQYKNVNKEQLESIKNDKETKKLIISNDRGYSTLEDSENKTKPYLFIKEYNKQGLETFPITLSKGRLPERKNEIVLSEEVEKSAKVKFNLGEQLTVDIGKRFTVESPEPLMQNDSFQISDDKKTLETLKTESTETYTIVGFIKQPSWEYSWSPGYTAITYIDEQSMEENVNAVVVLKNIHFSIYDNAMTLASEQNIEDYQFNTELLRYYGVTNNDDLFITLFSLLAIIISVIMIGSISLIYNAFAISVSERSRHLGMLSSVGATKKQKRNSVFFEGFIIGTISIPIGLIAGVGGIAITFSLINTYLEGALGVPEKLIVTITPLSIIIPCIVSMLTIFLSTFVPAKRASKVSAIDAIRQTQDIKLSKKAVKTPKLVRKMFGIEAEIGLKNLKRNKRRYQATVFSLVISIVLFLTVSFFTSNLQKSYEMTQENVNFDIKIELSDNISEQEIKSYTTLHGVTETAIIHEANSFSLINQENLPKALKELVQLDDGILQDGKFPYYIMLYGMDEKSFHSYAKQVGVNPEKLINSKEPVAIVIDFVTYQDGVTGKFIETKTIETEIGETIDLYSMNDETNEQNFMNKVKVGALTDQVPMGVSTSSISGLDIVVSEKTMETLLTEQVRDGAEPYLFMNSIDPLETQSKLEEIIPADTSIYNVHEKRQSGERLILMMSIFTYGFIVLISLISIANIFNTISTSIALRRREFAMLKSVGMTPKGFNKMIHFESIFYGIKALLYGLPISLVVMFLIYFSMQNTFDYGFVFPVFSVVFVILSIFIIVGIAMLYSSRKVKRDNIIDGLKQENI